MKPRRFKTRNGSIIEDRISSITIIRNNFVDDYEIIKSIGNDEFKDGEYICLLLKNSGFPTGNAHGKGWDIIEEVI
jgi:hypothetical protein